MPLSDGHGEGSPAGGDWFTTTHWSIVLAAGQTTSIQSSVALEELCRIYWYPLYAYVRRRGHAPAEAEDLTQEFLARLLANDFFRSADAQKGKFRSFLLAAINHFLANEHDRAAAAKRGGGKQIISLDGQPAEERYQLEPVSDVTPADLFERRWAWTVLDQALKRLREEYCRTDKAEQFNRLKEFLEGEAGAGDYERIGQAVNMTPGAVAVAVHRLRHRYREMVRAEIAQTVDSPEEIDDEVRHLFAVLAG